MPKKKQIGADNKEARARSMALLVPLKGKHVSNLTPKEQADLLMALAIMLKVVDKYGKIK